MVPTWYRRILIFGNVASTPLNDFLVANRRISLTAPDECPGWLKLTCTRNTRNERVPIPSQNYSIIISNLGVRRDRISLPSADD